MKHQPSRRPARPGDVAARVAVVVGLAAAVGLMAIGSAPGTDEVSRVMACVPSAHAPLLAL